MDTLISSIMQNIIWFYLALIVYVVFLYGFQICLMLAVGFDCKAKGIKRQALWMILVLFFPLIGAIIYACVRNSEAKENYKKCNSCTATIVDRVDYCPGCGGNMFTPCEIEKKQKYSKNSMTCLIVSIVAYVIAITAMCGFMFNTISLVDNTLDGAINNLNSMFDDDYDYDYHYDYDEDYSIHYGYKTDGKTVYYDREGKSYTDDLAVVYYDKQNKPYTFSDYGYSFVDSDGNEYDTFYSYVDENGYFYFDESGFENEMNSTIYYSAKNEYYVDKDGVIYFYADEVSWDKDGNLIDCYGDSLLD